MNPIGTEEVDITCIPYLERMLDKLHATKLIDEDDKAGLLETILCQIDNSVNRCQGKKELLERLYRS